MTHDKIAPRSLLENASDSELLREMVGFAAECLNHCNGYRERDWETGAGTVKLQIPQAQEGQLIFGLSGAPADRR